MLFQKLIRQPAIKSVPENAGYTFILASTPGELPPEAAQDLYGADMSMLAPHQSHVTPAPIVFLDKAENCRSHSAAIQKVSNRLFAKSMMQEQVPGLCYSYNCAIGGPRTNGFYLPNQLLELAPLVAKAAAVAEANGELGRKWHEITIRRDLRPNSFAEWHTHDSCTNVICASEVSGEFVLESSLKGPKGSPDVIFSPLAGMPVAIRTAHHTHPYVRDGMPKGKLSDVVIIYAVENKYMHSRRMAPELKRASSLLRFLPR